jgi:type IV secretory pathway VirB10-like protein
VLPVPLALLALSRPPSDRPKFIALAAAGAVLWVGFVVVSVASGNEDAETASQSPTTAEEEAVVTTTRAPATTTTEPTTTTTAAPTTIAPPPPSAAAPPAAPSPSAAETVSQRNARQKGADYLDYTSFSRSGLIEQLMYEGFSTEDATYAVDALNVDWNEQAAKKAAEYLDYTSFSHSGLVEQLVYEGFTQEQAEYGVSTTGL